MVITKSIWLEGNNIFMSVSALKFPSLCFPPHWGVGPGPLPSSLADAAGEAIILWEAENISWKWEASDSPGLLSSRMSRVQVDEGYKSPHYTKDKDEDSFSRMDHSIPLWSELALCGGLTRNAPCRLLCLNTWCIPCLPPSWWYYTGVMELLGCRTLL